MSNLPDQSRPTSLGALIRAASDGELTPGQQRALDEARRADPQVDVAIAFERRLRDAVGSAMGSVAIPAGLAEQVRTAVASNAQSLPEQLAEHTRRPSFWGTRRLTGLLAATIVLTLGAALLVQALSLSTPDLNESQLAYRQQVASFVASEHGRCCGSPDTARSKLSISDPAEAESVLSAWMGHSVSLPCQNRRPEIRFDGAGPCGIPGSGPSAHVMYHPAAGGPRISIFLKPDSGELPFQPGKTYVLDTKKCGVAGTRIVAWINGGVVYYAVFDETPGCDKVFADLGISPPSAKF
ncbi:MAG: hypothetical protein KJZ65_02230 [Phycisphaerales bacterium]|nr:hypothetical protein [Phycisphaerales bacterium]